MITHSSYTPEAPSEAKQCWQRVMAKLKFRYGEAAFNSWLKSLTLESLSGSEVVLTAPTRFIAEWVSSHYMSDIVHFWQEEQSHVLSVRVNVRAAQAGTSHAKDKLTDAHEQAITATFVPSQSSAAAVQNLAECGSPLDPRFTFQNFVVGTSNELAHAAARSLAEGTSVVPGSNPLFLYGGVGLGKTHLMHAIAHHIKKTNPNRTVVYLSAEKFMYLFIRALRDKNIMQFKDIFRSVDVLMVDDIQFISGKDSTQEEFFHTCNALIDNNKQLVISADRSPSDLEGVEERIRSRLGWGLVADIHATSYELRLGILESKVATMQVPVPHDVLEFLAHKISSNVRELEGALNKVVAHARLVGREITLDGAQSVLSDLLRANQRSITVDDIKKAVCDHCNVRIADLHSERRSKHIARPRQLAMFLAKRLTTHSLPEIGRKFGGRDHTTVMHAVKRIEELSINDRVLADDIQLLTRMLQS